MEKKIITEPMIHQYEKNLLEDEKCIATVRKYTRDITAFYEFVGSAPLTKEIVIQYKHCLTHHYAPASVNSMLAAVNGFLKAQGWYDCTVKSVRIQPQAFRPKEKELTKEEYYRLLTAASEKKNERISLLMQTVCSTGIRISELRFITVEAARRGSVQVFPKGKNRQILLPSSLCRKLTAYAQERHIPSGSIFVTKTGKPMDRSNIYHEMQSLCKAANVSSEKAHPHNLRHLFACQYYNSSKDLSHLADLLGHSSVNTTRIYTSISSEEQISQIEQLGLVL